MRDTALRSVLLQVHAAIRLLHGSIQRLLDKVRFCQGIGDRGCAALHNRRRMYTEHMSDCLIALPAQQAANLSSCSSSSLVRRIQDPLIRCAGGAIRYPGTLWHRAGRDERAA